MQSCHDDQQTSNTRAAKLPVTVAAMNGHTGEYDLLVCKDHINPCRHIAQMS